MDGIGELIAISSDFQQKQKILTYEYFVGAKYRLQKPRRRSWSCTKDVSLCGTPSEKYFLRFDNIFEGQVANTTDTVGSFSSFLCYFKLKRRKRKNGSLTKTLILLQWVLICVRLVFSRFLDLRPTKLVEICVHDLFYIL